MRGKKLFKNSGWKDFRGESESCVIVGNSGLANDFNCGEFVDSFDCVVRMNDAPTEGYEDNIGKKTDVRVINKPLQQGKVVSNADTSKKFLKKIHDQKILLYPADKITEDQAQRIVEKRNDVYRVSKDFKDYKREIEENLSITLMSTGLFCSLFFIHIFGRVSLINFDFYSDNRGSYHYWENFDGGNLNSHDFDVEKSVMVKLQKEGKLTFEEI